MGDVEASITKTVFWENLKKSEIRNEIDPDAIRSMYENYTNHLLDVK